MKELYEGFPLGDKVYIPKESAELLNKDPFYNADNAPCYAVTNFNTDGLELLVVSTKGAFKSLWRRFIAEFDRKYPRDDPAKEQRWWMARTDLVYPKEADVSGWIYLPLREKSLSMFGPLNRKWVQIVPEEGRLMIFKPEAIGKFFVTRTMSSIPEKCISTGEIASTKEDDEQNVPDAA